MRVSQRTNSTARAHEELGLDGSMTPVERLSPVGYVLSLLAREKDRTIHLPKQDIPELPSKGIFKILFQGVPPYEQIHNSIWRTTELGVARHTTGVSAEWFDPHVGEISFFWEYPNDNLTIRIDKQVCSLKKAEPLKLEQMLLHRIDNFGEFHI